MAKIALGAFFLAIVWSGIFIGGTALHDPDTCWLLALGRWMIENHSLPAIEPFSFTFAGLQRPLVLYQWLSECIFYAAYKAGGLVALLNLIAVLIMTSFVLVPLKLFGATKASWTVGLTVIFLGLVSASVHFLARPECLSYLFLSLSLLLLTMHRFGLRNAVAGAGYPFDWKFVAAQVAIMIVWANCHTGFTSGLVVLALYFLSDTIGRAIFRVRPSLDLAALLAFVVAAAASACTPYGFKLWAYIPSLFFANFNYMIAELHAIDFSKAQFFPFFALLAVWLYAFYRAMGSATEAVDAGILGKRRLQLLESLCVVILCCVESFSHMRLIPFAVLILTSELSLLLTIRMAGTGAEASGSSSDLTLLSYFDFKLEEGLAPVLKLGSAGCAFFVLLMALSGTLLTCLKIQPPMLPQSGGTFQAPFKAADAVAELTSDGNLLNDAQFGDLMVWYHPAHPKVFIDTRYDMYGEALVRDYLCLMQAKPGWEKLLESYKIKTVFVRPVEPIAVKLGADQKWHVTYSDERATVLTR